MNPPSNLTLLFVLIISTGHFNSVYSANNTRSSIKYRRGLTQANQTLVTPSHHHQNEQSASVGSLKKNNQRLTKETNSIVKNEQVNQENIEQIVDSWNSLDFFATKFTNRLAHQILEPVFDDLFVNSDVSLGCQSSIRTVLRDAGRMKKYAVQSKSNTRLPLTSLIIIMI